VKQLLASHRLVTLTGAGGSGKTRLALRAAGQLLHEFEQGIWLVELASLFNPALISQTIALSLNLREGSGQPLPDTLVDFLFGRDLLLIQHNDSKEDPLTETGPLCSCLSILLYLPALPVKDRDAGSKSAWQIRGEVGGKDHCDRFAPRPIPVCVSNSECRDFSQA